MKTFFYVLMALTLSFGQAYASNEVALPANELGKIMVLMYHVIGPKEAEFARTTENFRKDLELLYSKGYYLVNLVDLIDGKLKVPAGKTPVVLTFDDATHGQIEKNPDGQWSADCAVGMINAMYEKHPDFGRAGSFYLNANHKITGAMLREMVELGYELGNHTYDHANLKKSSPEKISAEIADLQQWIQKLIPGYRVRTMAIPFGEYPKEVMLAAQGQSISGRAKGTSYHNEALLKVGSEPALSPYSVKFDPLKIPRVRGGDGPNAMYLTGAVDFFEKNPGQRFISDGNPDVVTVPAAKADQVRKTLPSGLTVQIR